MNFTSTTTTTTTTTTSNVVVETTKVFTNPPLVTAATFAIENVTESLSNMSKTSNLTTTTIRMLVFAEDSDSPLGVSLGLFAAILFGSLLFIFILLGACVIWHTIYMRCLKKAYV
jgi:hypothetical protein